MKYMLPEATIRLRPMIAADLHVVIGLERQTYPHPWPAFFFRRLLRGNASCWVYESGGAVIGYGIMRPVRNGAHIMNICLAPSYRHRGLGRRMMLHLMSVAHRQGATLAWLEVKPTNDNAIALYRSMGFRVSRRCKGYYRSAPQRQHDALLMCCSLRKKQLKGSVPL
jgi:ribosomal-protein-alanine N-acetyltransferase